MAKYDVSVLGLRGFPDVQGGVEKHCQALYPRMKDLKINVYRRRPYITDGRHASPYPNIVFTDLPSTRIKGAEALIHSFLAALHTLLHPAKVTHVHNIGPGLVIPLLRLMGRKVVMTYHSPNYEHAKWGAFSRAVLRLGEAVSLRTANKIIFVNKTQREKYPDYVLRKSVYLPNGIDAPSPTPDADLLAPLGIHKGEYLLGVGRITEEKGFDSLVEAVQDLDEVSQLVIAGGSDHDTRYAERLRKLDRKGKLVLTGAIQGELLRQVYSHARMFVLSSINEGFPLVLLEAMHYRLPIAVSRIPATDLPLISEECKFTPGDPASIAETLSRLLPALPGHFDYDLSPYDWEEIAATTANILTNC